MAGIIVLSSATDDISSSLFLGLAEQYQPQIF